MFRITLQLRSHTAAPSITRRMFFFAASATLRPGTSYPYSTSMAWRAPLGRWAVSSISRRCWSSILPSSFERRPFMWALQYSKQIRVQRHILNQDIRQRRTWQIEQNWTAHLTDEVVDAWRVSLSQRALMVQSDVNQDESTFGVRRTRCAFVIELSLNKK